MKILKRLSDLTLNAKVSFLLIFTFLAALVTITVVLTASIRALTQQVSHDRTVQESSLIQAQFQALSDSLLNAARVVIGMPGIADGVVAGNADNLKTLLLVELKDISVDEVNVYDVSGKLLLRQFQNIATPVSDTAGSSRLVSLGLIGVEVTELAPKSGLPADPNYGLLIMAAAPVKNGVGDVVGVVVVEKELNGKVLKQIDFGRQDIQLSLIYRGRLLANTADRAPGISLLPGDEALQRVASGQVWISPDYISDDKGNLASLAYVPIPIGRNTEALAMLQVNLGNLFAFQQDLVRSTLVVFGALSLGGVLLASLFMRLSILNPLQQLTAVTQAMSGGDYSTRASATSADEIGQLAGAFNSMADRIKGLVTSLEQRVHEAQLARDHAERADKVKSAFLASMSHELRTPLNAIINFTKFVAKGTMGPVNAEQKETLDEVIDSAKHLLNLINDVLDIAKIESGSLALFIEENVDLNTILKPVISTSRSLLAGKSVALHTEIDEHLPVIRADRQRILQALLNIVSNAAKFTEQGFVRISCQRQGDEIRFAIQDTGPGIAAEDSDAVFQPFKQTATGIRQGGGTGLGIPISRSLIEAHGGRLWFESVVGEGTTFYVVLPVRSEQLSPELALAGVVVK